jgi:thiosulfate/3-mercaptopyruvate sulfurtransferase
MDGGRKKWETEGRPLTREVPTYPPANYTEKPMNPELRI